MMDKQKPVQHLAVSDVILRHMKQRVLGKDCYLAGSRVLPCATALESALWIFVQDCF
jgi:hypothetical protein